MTIWGFGEPTFWIGAISLGIYTLGERLNDLRAKIIKAIGGLTIALLIGYLFFTLCPATAAIRVAGFLILALLFKLIFRVFIKK